MGRYIEVSLRNPVSKILVGNNYSGGCSSCGTSTTNCASNVCIDIQRAGFDNCSLSNTFNTCCSQKIKPLCNSSIAHVCATEIDDNGYAIFVWPKELYNLKEGWYEGHVITNGCNECAVLPLRIGARCNVVKVEAEVFGPDCADWVSCDTGCKTLDPCESQQENNSGKTKYVPSYY